MLINASFRRLWWGQAISALGDSIFNTTLLLWLSSILLAGRSYAPTVSSAMLVLVSVTAIFVGPIAGVYVDRTDKKRVMLRADLIRAGLMAALVALTFADPAHIAIPAQLGVIALIVVAATAVAQFFLPARFAVIADVVPSEHQGKASSHSQTSRAMAILIGPPIAAALLVTVGYRWALALNALSFVVSYWAIRGVALPARPAGDVKQRKAMRKDFAEGLRFVRTDRTISTLLGSVLFVTIAAGVLNALEVYFVPENLHAPASWYGGLVAAAGGGTLLGSFVGGRLGDRVGLDRVYRASLLLFGLTLLAYSRMTNVWPTLALSVLFGLSLGSLNTALFPIILQRAPKELLGRVMAVINPLNQAAGMLAVMLSGALVGTVMRDFHVTFAGLSFGRIDTIFLAGGMAALLAGVIAVVALPSDAAAKALDVPPAVTDASPMQDEAAAKAS